MINKKLRSSLDNLDKLTEMNTKDINEFKEFTHIIADALEIIESKVKIIDKQQKEINRLKKRVKIIERNEFDKGFHDLSCDINNILKQHREFTR